MKKSNRFLFKYLLASLLIIPATGFGAEKNSFQPKKLEDLVKTLGTEIKKKDAKQTGWPYGIVVNALNPFWTATAIGGQVAANELGVVNSFQAAAQSADVEIQKGFLNSMIDGGYKGIAVSPVDSGKLVDMMNKAKSKDVKIIAIDSDLAPAFRYLYVGTDNYKAGVEAGKALVKVLGKNGGKVVGTVGNILAANSKERIRGITDGIKGSKVELVSVLVDQNDLEKAAENARSALKDHSDLKALITIYAYNAPAALKALEETGKKGKVKIVAFDLAAETIQGLKTGAVSAAVGQRPYFWGRLSVYIPHAMNILGVKETLALMQPWLEGPQKDILDTGIDIVTPENLKSYMKYLSSLGLKEQ
jgi:ribose transport system substrate-binding protein